MVQWDQQRCGSTGSILAQHIGLRIRHFSNCSFLSFKVEAQI